VRDNVAARTAQEEFGRLRCSIVHACDNYPVRWADKVGHEDPNQADLPELIGSGIAVGWHYGIIPREYELLWNTFVSSHRAANHE
jgi:hypothetical protein